MPPPPATTSSTLARKPSVPRPGGAPVSTEPTEPYPLPDTGSYREILDGDVESVVVPKDYFLQLRALELYADGEAREMAEGVVAIMKLEARKASGEAVYYSVEEVRRRLEEVDRRLGLQR